MSVVLSHGIATDMLLWMLFYPDFRIDILT